MTRAQSSPSLIGTYYPWDGSNLIPHSRMMCGSALRPSNCCPQPRECPFVGDDRSDKGVAVLKPSLKRTSELSSIEIPKQESRVVRMAPPHVIDLTGEEGSSELRGGGRNLLQGISNRPIAKKTTKSAAAKKKKARKAPVLLWIPHNGSSSSHNGNHTSTWRKFKALGVFSTKDKAMVEKEQVMSRYEQCGHGDILIDGTWDDEVDLIIKPVDCFFDDDRAE